MFDQPVESEDFFIGLPHLKKCLTLAVGWKKMSLVFRLYLIQAV
jgi:hypothetical protein